MKKRITVLAAFSLLVLSGLAQAQNTQPLAVFPYIWQTTNVPLYSENVDNLCTTDIVDSICQVDQNAGVLTTKEVPYSGTVPYSGIVSGETTYAGSVPYTGSVPYGGSVPYSGEVPYSGTASYSGSVPYSGETYYSGPLPIKASGSVQINTYENTETFTYAVTAPLCQPGVNKGCCTAVGNPDDGSVTLVCQKIDPTTLIDNSTFTYDICQATTLDVPWTFESTGQYDGYVPYSGTASYEGSVSYSGTAPFSGSASYSGAASFSGTTSYSGTVPFTADYSGSVNYSGNSVCEYKEYASTDVIFQEGNVILDCPEQPDVPSQEVTFKTLVTRAKVGDVIRLDATGWTPGSSVSYMIIVQHAKPGKGYKNVFVKTKKPVKGQTTPGADGVFTVTSINLKDGTLVDLQDDGYVLDQPGSYRFKFKVWDATGKSAGKIVTRVVSVTE